MAEYTYNARNQIDQTVIENGLFTVGCPDDGLGSRVARTTRAGGVGGLIMVEQLPGGGGTPAPYFPAYDGNGNITTWLDANGVVTARLRYDAFGNILSCVDGSGTLISPLALPSEYGFSTKPADRVTGMLYYGYRYLDPVTGRWPSRDPIEEEGGVNLYGFVGNDSLNWWDLLGEEPREYRRDDGSVDYLCFCKDLPDELGKAIARDFTDPEKHMEACCVALREQGENVATLGLAKLKFLKKVCAVADDVPTKPKTPSKCVNGTWKVGNCIRVGPVVEDCPGKSPFAIGPTRQAAQAKSLGMLPAGCHGTGGASYHHCTAHQCVKGKWVRRM